MVLSYLLKVLCTEMRMAGDMLKYLLGWYQNIEFMGKLHIFFYLFGVIAIMYFFFLSVVSLRSIKCTAIREDKTP